MEFLLPLLTIICIDLVLAGDNAVVIAMAVRDLPANIRKKAIIAGTVGAVIVRAALAALAIYLLSIPYLQAVGGLILLPIALKLLKPEEKAAPGEEKAPTSFWGAIKIIVIADAVMGVDNVLAIAGASEGHFGLIVAGLLISVPILAWGSSMIAGLMDKYPILIVLGASILAYTAAAMILHDPIVGSMLAAIAGIQYLLPACFILIVVAWAWRQRRKK